MGHRGVLQHTKGSCNGSFVRHCQLFLPHPPSLRVIQHDSHTDHATHLTYYDAPSRWPVVAAGPSLAVGMAMEVAVLAADHTVLGVADDAAAPGH